MSAGAYQIEYSTSPRIPVEAVGSVRLVWDRSGASSLTFQVKESCGIDQWDEVALYYEGTRAFWGRVQGVTLDDDVKVVVAVDWLGMLEEVPLFGRSSQVSSAVRNARVKWAYTPENVAGGNLYMWTVGAIVQDILNNAYAGLGSDSLPVLADVLPTAVAAGMADAHTTWRDSFATWIATYQADPVTATGAFAGLTLKPWGQQVDGVSVLQAIMQVLGRYYPSMGLYLDQSSGVLVPYETYEEDPYTVNCATSRKAHLSGVEPALGGCYTRLIVEGQHSSLADIDTYCAGFVNTDAPTVMGSGSEKVDVTPPGNYYARDYNDEGIDTESYHVSRAYGSWAFNAALQDTVQGTYYKDTRYRHDTGWGGTAYAGGVKRCLTIVDDTLGDSVYVTENDTYGSSKTHLVDRSDEAESVGNQVWQMLRDVRYVGTLTVPGTPLVNPAQMVRVMNEPRHGTLVFRPQSIQWDGMNGLVTYSLGDRRYNPIEELKLLNGLRWRDKANQRSRMPGVLR